MKLTSRVLLAAAMLASASQTVRAGNAYHGFLGCKARVLLLRRTSVRTNRNLAAQGNARNHTAVRQSLSGDIPGLDAVAGTASPERPSAPRAVRPSRFRQISIHFTHHRTNRLLKKTR